MDKKIQVKITREENASYYNKKIGDIIEIPLEEYLCGVVASEVGNPRINAACAQAVAARTFALARTKSGSPISDASSTAQAFRASRLNKPTYQRAYDGVKATQGEVLHYKGNLISAVYHDTNGGHTVSAKERWGSDRPYLPSQPDPWDGQSGVARNSHSVGMSQRGIKYAASIGKTYQEMLAFYYPGTQIKGNYGEESKEEEPMGFAFKNLKWDKSNTDFVNFVKQLADYDNKGKNKQPYWFGTCCYWCTNSLYSQKKSQYPTHYPASLDAQRKDDIANGRIAGDCVGILKGYAWFDPTKNKTVKNSNCPDTTATGLYNLCKIKGSINTIPEVPGLCVWKSGHIGVYIGNGEIVEARGRKEGIIVSTLKTTSFTNWGVVPFISYAGYEALLKPVSMTGKNAVVNTKGAEGLNIWSDTQRTKSKKSVAKGKTVYVKEDLANGWVIAQFEGVEGYVAAEYLVVSTVVPIPDPVEEPDVKEGPLTRKHALVNTKYDAGLNLWKDTNRKESVVQIAKGQVVFVKTDLSNGWVIAEYNGKTGYIDAKYLAETEIYPEPTFEITGYTITITCSNQKQLDAAIDYVNDKFEEE